MNFRDHLKDLVGRLCRGDLEAVAVTITGPPGGAIAVARALAVPVASMRHTPDGEPQIRLDLVCHPLPGGQP